MPGYWSHDAIEYHVSLSPRRYADATIHGCRRHTPYRFNTRPYYYGEYGGIIYASYRLTPAYGDNNTPFTRSPYVEDEYHRMNIISYSTFVAGGHTNECRSRYGYGYDDVTTGDGCCWHCDTLQKIMPSPHDTSVGVLANQPSGHRHTNVG